MNQKEIKHEAHPHQYKLFNYLYASQPSNTHFSAGTMLS